MAKNELAIYEEMAMITIKSLEKDSSPVYRFMKWSQSEQFFNEINSSRAVRIGDEFFPSRNIEKVEKVTGRVPTKRVLHILERKIAKYRSTWKRHPNEATINTMTENAFKELE